MPLKRMALKLARKLVCMEPQEQEDAVPEAIPPELEPDEAHAVEPGRPYQDYVESEARRYWQSLVGRDSLTIVKGSLTKPDQEELRAAAMPVLGQALRRRTGSEKYLDPNLAVCGVGALLQYALGQGWIKQPLSEVYAGPFHVNSLIQLADDANWLAREIPLPDHPPPYHPPIYYTWDLSNNLPVPRENSLIRGDYVYTQDGLRITKADYIKPWPYGDAIMLDRKTLLDQGWDACYTMYLSLDKIWYVLLFWAGPPRLANGIPILHRSLLENMHFSPYAPS